MIDKSIRQHYENGKDVSSFRKGMETIMPKVKQKFFPQDDTGLDEKQLIKNVAGSAAKNLVTRKLATQLGGTGILSSLGPIGMLIAYMLAKKGIGKGQDYLTQKGGALQAFQAGFGSPQEGRELRNFEKRRADMLQRKEEGKNYSERNLDIVTRSIAEAKGLDINNPNEMKNIDKPIRQIQIEKSITEPPQIIPEEPEIKSPFAKVIPKTPEVIIPHLEEDRTIPTPTRTTDFKFEDTKRAAQEKAEKQAEFDRAVAENAAKAAAEAAAQRAYAARVPDRIYGGGNGGNRGGGGQAAADAAGGSSYSSPFLKGGRVDKALSGRSRDI